jgi:serine O-acetyltransferase
MNCFVSFFKGVRNDYRAYAASSSSIKALFKIHFYCNVCFRISHFFFQIKLLPVARIFWLFNRVVFSIDIDPGAKLNGGMEIVHGIGVVIGRYVISEGRFKIYHGATLGGNNGKEAAYNNMVLKQPYIKDKVIIGINSAVLGPIVIGAGAVIGTHALVTKDVADNCTIIGNNKILTK